MNNLKKLLTVEEKLAESQRRLDAVRKHARANPPSCKSCSWECWASIDSRNNRAFLCTQPLVSDLRTNTRGQMISNKVLTKMARSDDGICGYHGDLFAPKPKLSRMLTTFGDVVKTLSSIWLAMVFLFPIFVVLISVVAYNFHEPLLIATGLLGAVIYLIMLCVGAIDSNFIQTDWNRAKYRIWNR